MSTTYSSSNGTTWGLIDANSAAFQFFGPTIVSVIKDNNTTSTIGDRTSAVTHLAGDFTSSYNYSLDSIDVYLKQNSGITTGNITLQLWSDDGGFRPNALITTSTNTIVESILTVSYQWINFTFPAGTNIVSGTTYWIVTTSDYATGFDFNWGFNGIYPPGGGNTIYNSPTVISWNSLANNIGLMYRVWGH